tara:strand:+ start:1145 stop:1531 length:387 start_codon:yes stop_codon:yes gene_type:complete
MSLEKQESLIFIYNADSGLRNMILDGAHKIFSPETYTCSLCGITYGAFAENKRWKKFREEHKSIMKFLHKDEFNKQYASKFGHRFSFPIVLITGKNGFEVLIKTEELDALEDVGALIGLIEKRILSLS